MKKLRIIALVLAAVLLSGCASGIGSGSSAADEETDSVRTETEDTESAAEDAEFTASLFAMDTYMELKAYGPGAEQAVAEIQDEITMLDSLLSVTLESSDIYEINHSKGAPVSVADTTASLIQRAVALGDRTGNVLDISIYPVLSAWGFTTGDYRIPSDDELSALLQFVDDGRIQVDGNTVTIEDGMEIDLGSVVKGYLSDRTEEILAEHQVGHALMNFGGSTIRTVGSKPDGSSWKIAIQDPTDSQNYAGILEMTGGSVNTSGGYERYFEEDGEVYWHILDPESGKPAKSGLISVTILGGTGFDGDGLSTALFVMGLDDAIAYWREHPEFDFVLITDSEEIYVSEGAAAAFSPYGNFADAPVYVVKAEA